jgi:hypothetical protein
MIDNGGNVIFNINNMFKVIGIDRGTLTVNVEYGRFADVKWKFDQELYKRILDKFDFGLLDFKGKV